MTPIVNPILTRLALHQVVITSTMTSCHRRDHSLVRGTKTLRRTFLGILRIGKNRILPTGCILCPTNPECHVLLMGRQSWPITCWHRTVCWTETGTVGEPGRWQREHSPHSPARRRALQERRGVERSM